MKFELSILVMILLITFSSFGCLGFGNGYVDKAQEYSSADYTISTYKDFLEKYNAVCNVGSSAESAQSKIDNYIDMKGDPKFWTFSENQQYEQLLSVKMGYEAQYNRLTSEYNKMAMDKTQDWLMIATLPERIDMYTDKNHLTNNNQIDDKILGSEVLGR